MATQWYWRVGDEQRGPVSFRELALMVGDQVLNEDDLVRPEYSKKWQAVDSVVGLYHMAEKHLQLRTEENQRIRIAENEQDKDQAAIASVLGGSGVIADVFPKSVARPFAGRGERQQVFFGDAGCDDEAAGDGLTDKTTNLESFEGNAPVPILEAGEVASAIDAAVKAWDERHAAPLADESLQQGPSLPRQIVRLVSSVVATLAGAAGALFDSVFRVVRSIGIGTICRWLERTVDHRVMAWGFRAVCSATVAGLVAWGAIVWSRHETMKYPNPEWIAAGKTVMPFVGPCLPIEFQFLLLDLVVVSGVAGYLTAVWLEKLTE